MPNNSEQISSLIKKKIQDQTDTIDFSKEQIVVLDNARSPYQDAIIRIDSSLYKDIQDVNNTLIAVRTAYQDRITANCRSDLFWALTEYVPGLVDPPTPDSYTYQCVKVSYVGYPENVRLAVTSGVGVTMGDPIPSEYGYQTDNLHGIKIYDEPYAKDIFSTYVGSSIGTVGAASTILYLLSPINGGGIAGLSTGQLVLSSKNGVFSGNYNEIVGVGTTTVGFASSEIGISTSSSVINTITLKNSTIFPAAAPEEDGSYVTFTILKDPDTVSQNYGIPFGSSPYVKQTIKMMDSSSIGEGVAIEYDNSGNPNVAKQWNKFMEGFDDPDDNSDKIVTKPLVGSGLIYYREAFTQAPAVYSGGSFDHYATEGETVVTIIPYGSLFSPVGYESLSSCTPQETALTNAISTRDAKESEFASGSSTFTAKINLSNALREDLSDLNIRIWGYRMQVGKAEENQSKYNATYLTVNDPEFQNLING